MKPQLIALKKYNFGKQIAAIEKLIFTGPPTYMTPSSVIPPSTQTPPIEITSSAPTPLLTDGQNSPQSSSIPSDFEEPSANASNPMIPIDEKPCPEVVINGV
jgi:mRNA-binding protein PUF3